MPKIGIDVDGVLCNFQKAIIKKAKRRDLDFYDHWTQWRSWESDYPENFEKLFEETRDNWSFWWNLEPYDHATRVTVSGRNQLGWLPFEPDRYISARSHAPSGVTASWLKKHQFPEADVHVVDTPEEKLEKVEGLDIYIDDKIGTILMMQDQWSINNRKSPDPILFSMPWNDTYSDDNAYDIRLRIDNLTDISEFVKDYN